MTRVIRVIKSSFKNKGKGMNNSANMREGGLKQRRERKFCWKQQRTGGEKASRRRVYK